MKKAFCSVFRHYAYLCGRSKKRSMIRTISILMFAAALLALSCKNDAPQKDAANNLPKVDTLPTYQTPSTDGAATFILTEGTVYWNGKKATGNVHTGTISVQSGELLVKDGALIGGNFVIDMNSITVTDLKEPKEKSDLESHLKDTDFFEAGKYPTGTFVIDEVLPSKNPAFNAIVRGDLTLKGKTNPINIPATVTIIGNELQAATVTFAINRTDFGVNFRSGILGTAKDKLIEDIVTLTMTLKAKRK